MERIDRKKRKKKETPYNESSTREERVRHTRAFDRVYICDFMFSFVDRCISGCIQKNSPSIQKEVQMTPFGGLTDLGDAIPGGIASYDSCRRGRVWSYFAGLNVSAQYEHRNHSMTFSLHVISAKESNRHERSNRYIYSILQGIKMGIICNHEMMCSAFPGISVAMCISMPAVASMLQYLQYRENYPPDELVMNYDKDGANYLQGIHQGYASSLYMTLHRERRNPYYWNVQTSPQANQDANETYLAMKQHNRRAASGVADLVPYDNAATLFCTETTLGTRICKDVATAIHEKFVVPSITSSRVHNNPLDLALPSSCTALVQAVFCRLLCTITLKEKELQNFPLPESMGRSTRPSSTHVSCIQVQMVKRMAFARDNLGQGVLSNLVSLVAQHVLQMGDMPICSIAVSEVDQMHTCGERQCVHEMLLYGEEGLQIDTFQRMCLRCSLPI